MESWVLEHPYKGMMLPTRTLMLYVADRATMERVLEVERRLFSDARIREATDQDWERVNTENLRYVELKPECRDWWFDTSFDGNSWPRVYRHTSLEQMLKTAKEKADGRCNIFFRPASPEEIKQDDEDTAEYLMEQEKEALRIVKQKRRSAIVGLVLQIVLTPLFAYWGLLSITNHRIAGLCLIGIAALSALSLLWALVTQAIYRISFIVGRGIRDGKAERQ